MSRGRPPCTPGRRCIRETGFDPAPGHVLESSQEGQFRQQDKDQNSAPQVRHHDIRFASGKSRHTAHTVGHGPLVADSVVQGASTHYVR